MDLVILLPRNTEQIEIEDYLNELKKQIFESEKSRKKGRMRVRNLEVELETVTESSGSGGLSIYVLHGEAKAKTQIRNKIKISLVSPDIIEMERERFGLEQFKIIADLLKKSSTPTS